MEKGREVTNMKKTLIVFMLLSLVALPLVAGAQGDLDLGLVSGDESGADAIGLGDANLKDTINSIIKVILSFLGILAVVVILWGGFIWMTAMGDEAKVDKAKTLIIAGIVGIVIILSAYAIAAFVINSANNAVTA